jgi:hypothetical protein
MESSLPKYEEIAPSGESQDIKQKEAPRPSTDCQHLDCKEPIDLRVVGTDLRYCRNHLPKTSKFDKCLENGCEKHRTFGYGTQMTPASECVYFYCFDHSRNFNLLVNDNLDLDKFSSIFEPQLGTKEFTEFDNDNKCWNSRKDSKRLCNVKSFSVVNRRHHCRMCGKSYCSKCCSKFEKLHGYESHELVRVCDGCKALNIEKYNQELEKKYTSMVPTQDFTLVGCAPFKSITDGILDGDFGNQWYQ